MSAQEQVVEILAREMYVQRYVERHAIAQSQARQSWYDPRSPATKNDWRERASLIVESLGASGISLTLGGAR